MRKFWMFLILISLILAPASANAQEAITIESLEVDLWPEYDRASMLVIYRVVLPQGLSYPTTVTVLIPTVAGEPNAVASRSGNDLLNTNYSRQVAGEWASITITATSPEIQLEFYDPQLEIRDEARHFEYNWTGEYKVNNLTIQVQQPAGSRDLQVSPALGEFSQGNDGLNYYTVEVGEVSEGQEFSLSVDYTKDSDSLTVEGMQVQPSAPIDGDTSGRTNLADYLPWMLGAAGLLLLGGGVVWFWRTSIDAEPADRRTKRGKRGKPTSRMDAPVDEDSKYCHQCGKRAGEIDKFCRNCGARLR